MSEIPQKIGPYRVVQRLGAGGMGEVFLAHDERLDRRVAIKRIRADTGLPQERERFRREARVAARLNHPAIVQVYDILQEEEVEHIVMEYVEGTTLRALAARGPLDLPLALRLAREIADGLDTAHHEGIVHRDLKTENVLVTRTGHAKISDFGIAKQLLAGPETALTQGDAVVGTCRAMSPEQARGEAVDQRSDLFSFGVLFYEILTGRSPFAAENPLATLNRILVHAPEPVQALRPEIPEEISGLVGQLLQKDPFLRPRSAGEVRWQLDALLAPGTAPLEDPTLLEGGVFPPSGRQHSTPLPKLGGTHSPTPAPDSALTTVQPRTRRIVLPVLAVLLAAALAAAGAWLLARRPPPPLYVAVLAPEIGTGRGSSEMALLASGVRVAVLQALVELEGISALSMDEVDAAAGSPRHVAQALSAEEVITARLDCRPETCRVSLNRLRGADGSVLWAESLEVPTDDFFLLARAVTGQIHRGYEGMRPRKGSTVLEASSRDIRELLALRRDFDAQSLPQERILANLEEIRRRSPRFLEAYLLEADVLRHSFWMSRRRQDLDRAFRLLEEARILAPRNPQPLFLWFDVALAGKDLERAEQALRDLAELVPGDVRVQEREARLLDARGRSEEALALMRTAARLHPSVRRLSNLAQMEFQQGRITAARGTLQQLLRRSPGNLEGLSLLALLELWNGDLQRAATLYQQLGQRSPGVANLSNLGLAYLLLGRYQEAAGTFRRACEREPQNPGFVLNLADAEALLGHKAEAEELYRRVVTLAAADPAAATPPLLTIKAQAQAHLGAGREAVSAVQEALRLAPDQGPTVYEAALVYVLLGEDHSALANAEKAVQLGLNPRAFSIPWFAPLQRQPEFRALLARAPAP
jgi:tetratricopeptide (TPR) repeat protein/predicted Ser/Thr protein kinase/TolB-like protein